MQSLEVIDGSVWLLAQRWNGMYVGRSDDAGITWTEIAVVPPPSSGAIGPVGITRGASGRLVIHASASSRCSASIDVGDGFFETSICRRRRPVVFVSDDDGATWRRSDPPAMAPPGDVTIDLVDVVSTADGFLAAGTVKGPDWHVRLWSSPDGENWSLDREVRAPGSFLSAEDLVFDGENLLLAASEHPCSSPNDNTPGWILGTAWVDHVRLYIGTRIADLELATPDRHPLARPPSPLADCAIVSGFDLSNTDLYPTARAALVGDEIVVLEMTLFSTEELDDDADLSVLGSRRLAQLVDGEWELIEVDGVPVDVPGAGEPLLDVDGQPGLFETESESQLLEWTRLLLPGENAPLELVRSDRPLVARDLQAATWIDGTLLVAGATNDAPFADVTFATDRRETLNVWRSVEVPEGEPFACDISANGSCRFGDLSTVDGYPDFTVRDLSGIDLSFADLGEADFSGSTLVGARMWEASSSGADFSNADLRLSQLGNAELGSALGANFEGASLAGATIDDVTDANLAGADLRRAWLGLTTLQNPAGLDLEQARLRFIPVAGVPFEISLAGVDLTDVSIDVDFSADELLVVTDLTGAVLDGASFSGVDLTQVGPEVDFTEIDVWDDSICPDGLPPDDGPIGTCVRAS
ncbi:MAG: pentapeptide repeat-containing protein [Ilumatobacter sp.]|uniref:pentapeptide repeat-containing protein n=1 Tax=Ilumatobacter sp. TaxID=1967498 RepID=UPI00391BDA8D